MPDPISQGAAPMAVNVSDWAFTTFGGSVVEALKEADKIGMPFTYRFDPGQANGKFPKIANRSVTSRNDNPGTDLAPSNTVEGSVTVGFDPVEGIHDYLTYQDIAVYNNSAPPQYGRSFGAQLAEKLQANIVAYCIKVACGTSTGMTAGTYRTDDLGEVVFNDDSDATDGTAIAGAVLSAHSRLTTDKVLEEGRLAVIHPTYFYQLHKVNYFVSRDYVATANNQNAMKSIKFAGCNHVPLSAVFNSNISSDPTYAAKYRGNFTSESGQGPVWGIVMHTPSLAIREAERPNGRIDDIPQKDSWLIQSRCIRGMEALQPTAFVALVGDA